MNPKFTGAKVGEIPVGKPVKMVVGGGDRREHCNKVDTKLGGNFQQKRGNVSQ